ncbi:uncharacterized protein LOC126690862 [Quercus robur]|uniref:uncharacterized protein LOC126690862 n=1 Tax=Quercus robur TaxID=38942 RepID=UPI0021639F8D|nr:uncharacterized protein LOC126690862 [Quercus robur]
MAQFLLLYLILTEALFVLALASEKTQTMVQPNGSPTLNPPSPSPSNGENLYNTEAPRTRKLGKHHPKMLKSYGEHVFSPSPSDAPQTVEKMHSTEESSSSIQTSPIDPNNQENVSDQEQGILPRKQHHSVDKSIAGGGVILGGLATTFLVAVFCYIRATGRHKDKAVAETVA